MKKRYSIGETARLLGVTAQTLRYYDKYGLLRPRFVNEETGYRYYAADQFHYIDRIKYLQKFGMPLEDIKQVLQDGSAGKLLEFLKLQRERKARELEEMKDNLGIMDWYIDYFSFLNKGNHAELLYKVELPARWVFAVPGYPDDIPIAKMEVRLAEAKAEPRFRNLGYLRQYAYIMDYAVLEKKRFTASHYFIYLKERPELESEHIIELPAGTYLCYVARILTDDWDVAPLQNYFKDRAKPSLVIANEFEENLVEYLGTPYEVQMLL